MLSSRGFLLSCQKRKNFGGTFSKSFGKKFKSFEFKPLRNSLLFNINLDKNHYKRFLNTKKEDDNFLSELNELEKKLKSKNLNSENFYKIMESLDKNFSSNMQMDELKDFDNIEVSQEDIKQFEKEFEATKKTDKFKNTNLDDLDSEYQRELDSIKKFADEIETIPKFQTFSTASAPPLPGSSDFIEKLSNDKNERNRLLENAEYHKISTWDMLIKDIGLSKASESTKEKSTKEESKSPNFNPTELETPPTTSRSNFKYRWLLALGVGGLILYLLLNQTDENKTLDSIPFFSFRFLRSAITVFIQFEFSQF